MDKKYFNKLEYNKILNTLSTFANTCVGKDFCLNLKPYFNKSTVLDELSKTTEALNLIIRKGFPPLAYIPDISVYNKILLNQSALSSKALLDLAHILKVSRELKDYFFNDDNFDLSCFEKISPYFSNLYSNLNIETRIFSSILDENTIADDASSKLNSLRKKRRALEQEIKKKLKSYIHSSYSKYVQDSIITIRNNRFVIPVKEEYRSMIKGFVHDVSSTGATCFIEPISVFELNNQINSLKADESIEIDNILLELSALLHPLAEDLQNDFRLIGILDFTFAKANFSKKLNAVEPKINNEKYINLVKARHPLIPNYEVVPVDIHIGSDFSCLVITGPNTGGKTVVLKTTGLLTLMAMSGLHIPASENSSIFVFDNVFADIGDEQSIQESLSTFSSHMLNIIDILSSATDNSLILIDELGSGTDPVEGSSLAISILQELYNKNSLVICTTHYPEIKNFALVTDGFENASSEFDIEHLKPTYKLLIGIPGKSNAFAISKKLGLPPNVLKRASDLLTSDDISIEELLKNIYDNKIEIEKEKEKIQKNSNQIETLRKSLEKQSADLNNKEKSIIDSAKIEARKILLSAKEEANDVIRELNSTKNANQLRDKLNSSIKKLSVSKEEAPNTNFSKDLACNDIAIGMSVLVKNLNQVGTVLSLPNKSNQVQVQIGLGKINVDIKNLSKSNTMPSNNKQFTNTNKSIMKSKTVSTEINVIGYNVEEAIFAIDKYLDDCSISKLKTVHIVHGKGTGTLRNGIHAFLKKHPHVESFRLGTFGEGEMGVTVVTLK